MEELNNEDLQNKPEEKVEEEIDEETNEVVNSEKETSEEEITNKETKGEEVVINKPEVIEVIKEEKVLPEKRKINKSLILYMVFTMILCACCSGFTAMYVANKVNKPVVVYQNVNSDENSNSNLNIEEDITDVVARIADTVVEVYTEKVSYNAFYGEYVSEGAGSGVIYSTDGYIITNNHVIDSASTINVTLNSGEKYEATLVATDAVSDLAVIKIEASNLPCAILGASSSLKVAQSCIAIGNPLGTLGGTVTTGIISALSREITIGGQKMNLLQTNASISPGNSGGGLFTTKGELIGIVNAKSSGSDIEGIGFAIPIDYAKEIVGQLIEYGYVLGRPSIGIRCVSIDSIQLAWNYGVNTYGVYVSEVISDNAKAAGILEKDVITGIEGITITNYTDMMSILNTYSAGDTIELTITRGREVVTVNVVLSQRQ